MMVLVGVLSHRAAYGDAGGLSRRAAWEAAGRWAGAGLGGDAWWRRSTQQSRNAESAHAGGAQVPPALDCVGVQTDF